MKPKRHHIRKISQRRLRKILHTELSRIFWRLTEAKPQAK